MSDVDISAISGGSGSFVTQKFFNGEVSVGASGDILTITAPLGKRVRLNYLAVEGSNTEPNVELRVDGILVNQSTTDLSNSSFTVVQYGQPRYSISDIVAREIIVKKTSGSTTNRIYYAYSEGV